MIFKNSITEKYEQQKTGPVSKIIHQTAPGDKSKWHPIWKHCQESWKTKFPDYEYKFWSDEDLENFIATKYPWFLDTYKGYDKTIKRVDSARYFILYEYGGIYADMDFECINNFEHLLPEHKVSIAESPWKDDDREGGRELYQNALMASPPKHPFWEKVFKLLEDNKNHHDVLHATGPQIICNAVKLSNFNHIKALESELFAPKHDDSFKTSWVHNIKHVQELKNPNIFSRHHGTAMWI